MNIHIYIENKLGEQLEGAAKMLGKTRNLIIREAIAEWLVHHKTAQWPPCIRDYNGLGKTQISPFESHRRTLKEPKDDPFQ